MKGRIVCGRARFGRAATVGSVTLAIALLAATSAAADIAPTPLQVNPQVDAFSPAATADYELWTQNSLGAPNHYNVYAQLRTGGSAVKANFGSTFGFDPSAVVGSPSRSFIFQQASGSTSNLVFYNPATGTRTALPAKVNSPSWEYYGVASTKYVAFMRLTNTARILYLYNRSGGGLTQLATVGRSCGSCLRPTWVGDSHVIWNSCSATTYVCNARVHTIGGGTISVPRAPAPYSAYGGAMDETARQVYFIRSTAYCGLFVEIRRWPLDGGAQVTVHALDEGVDAGNASLAPDITTPSDMDVLYSQYDCIAGDDDTYQLASANQAAKVAGRTPKAGAVRAGGLHQSAADIAAEG